MDSLTQVVLGAAVGEAAIGRKVGNWAILWGAVAGTIPDLDVFAKHFTDNITALEIHRGFSHSILFSVIFAPIFGWIVSKIHRKLDATWKDWTWLMFLGLITHPLLDAHTTWGTQLFWPLEYRLDYKNIFVVDPLYTLPFMIFLIAAMFYNKTSFTRRKLNNLGLMVSSCYMLLTVGIKWYTYPKFTHSLKEKNVAYIEVKNRPTPLNSILWAANVMVEDGFLIGYYSLFDTSDDIIYSEFIPKNHHLLGEMANEKKIKQLMKITEGWYTIEEKEGKLILNDLRFGQDGFNSKTANNFIFNFELFYDENGEFQAIEQPRTLENGDEMFNQLIERIKGI